MDIQIKLQKNQRYLLYQKVVIDFIFESAKAHAMKYFIQFNLLLSDATHAAYACLVG